MSNPVLVSELRAKEPEVTVLLPVYNGAKYLHAAINSVLNQTLVDFNFLIIDDGSLDKSVQIIKSFTDSRITLVQQENRGLAATLNRGLGLTQSTYIARQDQDDLSHPERLEKQLRFMQSNNDVILLGTAAEIWVENTPSGRFHDHPTNPSEICYDLLFNNPFVHSSVMFCRAAVQNMAGYSEDKLRQPPEDFELWSRLVRQYKVANLSERLVTYREVQTSMSRSDVNPFINRVVMIAAENIAWANQIDLNQDCIDVAALIHSANHLTSSKISLNRMSRLIEAATLTIEREHGDVLQKKMQLTLNNLRAQHNRLHHRGLSPYRLIAFAKRALKELLAMCGGARA